MNSIKQSTVQYSNSIVALSYYFALNSLCCAWVWLRGYQYKVDSSIPSPRMRSWLISAVVLGFLEEYLTNNK